MTLLATLFGFNGRLSRSTFWLCAIAVALIDTAAWLMLFNWAQQAFPVAMTERAQAGAAALPLGLPMLVIVLTTLWVGLALKVKRLHDRNRSGLWLLAWMIPVVGWIWLIWEIGLAPSVNKRNRYGLPGQYDDDEPDAASPATAPLVAAAAVPSAPAHEALAGTGHGHAVHDDAHQPATDHHDAPHGDTHHDEGRHGDPPHHEAHHADHDHDGHGHVEQGHNDPGHDAHGHDAHGHDAHGHDDHGHDDHGHDDHGLAAHGHDDHGHAAHDHDDHGHESHGHDDRGHEPHGEAAPPSIEHALDAPTHEPSRLIAEDHPEDKHHH